MSNCIRYTQIRLPEDLSTDSTTYRRRILARYRDYQTRRLEASHGN